MKDLDTKDPSWLFSPPAVRPKEKERGVENFNFYNRFLRKQIDEMMEKNNEMSEL